MAKEVLGEVHDLLRILPIEQLKMFAKIRVEPELWDPIQMYARLQKSVKMDNIYRLRRAKSMDDVVANELEHEYYAGRISETVIFLQLCENASNEIERRERKDK